MPFDLGSVIAHIQADISGFTAGLDQAKAQAQSFGEAVGNIGTNIRSFAEQASVFVGVEALALGGLAKEAIDVASNFEQAQVSFGTLLGSEQKAADLMKQIMAFEQHTPFDIQTLVNASKNMLAFGVSADEVVPKIKMLTDMSQGQTARLTELVSIYGQVNSIQSLNGREVLRLSSIGIPIYQALADHFNKMGDAAGTSGVAVNAFGETVTKVSKNNADVVEAANVKLKEQTAQLKILQEEHPKTAIATDKHSLAVMKLQDAIAATTQKLGDHTISIKATGEASKVTAEQVRAMISSHQITAQVFDQVLTELTSKGGLFFNENIRQMSTFSGIMTSVQSQLQYGLLNLVGIDIGSANEVRKGGLFDTLRGLAADLLDWLHKLQPALSAIGQNKTFQLAIQGMVIAIGSLLVILPAIAIAFNPVVLAVLAIEAVIVALYVAWNTNFMGIRDVTTKIVAEVTNFFNNYLKPVLVAFQKAWNEHWASNLAFLQAAWLLIKGVIEVAWAIVYGIIKLGLALLTGDWKNAWNAIKDIVQGAWNGLVDIFNAAVSFVKGWGGEILHSLTQPFVDAWNKISELMNKIKDAIDFTKRHSPSVIDIIENGVQLANEALSGLAFNNTFDVNPEAAFSGAMSGGGGSVNSINIYLDGAIIADSESATRISEKIGDSIIKRLQSNIRI